jgi:hypothetical protein
MSTIPAIHRRALLIGLLTLLLAPTSRADHNRADIWIKYDDVPRRARDVFDRERKGHDIKQILEIRLDGKVYYRALIDDRGADRTLLVSDRGSLVKVSEVPDLAVGEGSFERSIRYDSLPADIRKTLDHERSGRAVKQVYFVRRDNREFYRAIVDTKGDDAAIRINTNGKLLSIDEVDDIAIGAREASRYDYDRERSMRYDDVPVEVRSVIDRQRSGRNIKQVVYVEHNGRKFYRCVVDERGTDRVYRVGPDGYLYEERELRDISVGHHEVEHTSDAREEWVKYATLPRPAQAALDRARRGRDVLKIIKVEDRGHITYRCTIDSRPRPTTIRIDIEGHPLGQD